VQSASRQRLHSTLSDGPTHGKQTVHRTTLTGSFGEWPIAMNNPESSITKSPPRAAVAIAES
jgi:hypothetical protein